MKLILIRMNRSQRSIWKLTFANVTSFPLIFIFYDRSPSKNLPSPVKFVSAEKEEPDLSDLITALAKDQAIELNIPVTEAPVSSFLTNSSTEFPDVSAAVNDILNDLGSGDDTDTSSLEQSLAPEPSNEVLMIQFVSKPI